MSDEIEDSGSYYTDDAQPKKGGSIKKGIGIGVLVTLVFELFVSFALDAETNLVHRYVAYMLGIAALFVAALYAKSTWKMFFLGTPVIVATSFVLPIASPDNFSGLMSPFINLLPTINAIADSIGNIDGQDTAQVQEVVDLFNKYGIIFDFVLAIIVGTIAALGLVGFVKIFSNKPGILTIISFIFSLFFFLLGVIILPYILVVSTGVTQFGLALGAGGLNLSAGFDIINNDGDIADANAFFDEAQRWFDEADLMLEGLENMQVFSLLGESAPDAKVLIDNFLILIDSAVDMAKSIGPMFIGITALQEGMEKSMSVLSGSLTNTNLQMSELSTADDAIFEEGLVDVKAGFGNISKAIPDIQKALLRFEEVNREETLNAANAQGLNEVEKQLDLIEGAINLMNSALDILVILITPANDPNPSDGFKVEEPLIHLLRGAVALSDASTSVGATSSFEGTGPIFEKIVAHLEVVVDTLDEPVFDDFENTDVNNVTELTEVKEQLSGMFDFIHDTGSISIAMGEFGLIATPTLLQMNETMSIFQGRDFATIPDSEYGLAELNFTKSDGILNGSARMKAEGETVDALVAQMEVRSLNDEYGLMSAGATDFVGVFKEFDMGQNGLNFFHLSHGFFNVVKTARELTIVDGLVANIQTEVEFLTSGLDYLSNATAIDASITNIQGNSTDIGVSLDRVNITLTDASGNFTLVGTSMPQMEGTTTAIDGIIINVASIRVAIGVIEAETAVLPTIAQEFTDKTAAIGTQLTVINNELTLINGHMDNVEIAG